MFGTIYIYIYICYIHIYFIEVWNVIHCVKTTDVAIAMHTVAEHCLHPPHSCHTLASSTATKTLPSDSEEAKQNFFPLPVCPEYSSPSLLSFPLLCYSFKLENMLLQCSFGLYQGSADHREILTIVLPGVRGSVILE